MTLLPGSRLQEVTRMLPIFANTMEQLKHSFPELVTVIHVAPNQHVEDYINKVVHKWPVPAILIPGGSSHLKYDAFSVRSPGISLFKLLIMSLFRNRKPRQSRGLVLISWFA